MRRCFRGAVDEHLFQTQGQIETIVPWSSRSLVMWQLRKCPQDVHVRYRVQREGKRAEAAAAAGLPGRDTKREHELVGQVVADGDARFKVFAHFVKRFLRDILGGHAAYGRCL